MAKATTVFYCTNCGNESGKWMGRCTACGAWNTMEERPIAPAPTARASTKPRKPPQRIKDISVEEAPHISTGIGELDRVLGGGLIEGMAVLVGGEPGVGKSTLLLQACDHLANAGRNVLYVSGEESGRQIKLRARRLGVKSDNLLLLPETDMEAIVEQIEMLDKPIVILDSIQTMFSRLSSSAPGSVSQIRECASAAVRCAKEGGAIVLMVGHVTKEGSIAGPRVLEHMVDTVLYFEGERHNTFRVLRAVKNRFGSTNEIGVFEMHQDGMREVDNPSGVLISQRTLGVAGSAVTCALEGTRPVLCEVQALAASTTFGQPRRMASGVDYNRMLLMIAVLERSAGLSLRDRDVYVNAAGGLKLNEPASDLGVLAAIASAALGRPIKQGYALLGEVGLTGELRTMSQVQRRIAECAKMGFDHVILPRDVIRGVKPPEGVTLVGADGVLQALRECLLQTSAQSPSIDN